MVEHALTFVRRIEMLTDQERFLATDVRDAAIAHAAKVEVLREVVADGKKYQWPSPHVEAIAARHNITAAEIEPAKVYTEADIKVEPLPTTESCLICCGPFRWSAKGWLPGVFDAYSKHDAEAIAAHLRATKNFPEVK